MQTESVLARLPRSIEEEEDGWRLRLLTAETENAQLREQLAMARKSGEVGAHMHCSCYCFIITGGLPPQLLTNSCMIICHLWLWQLPEDQMTNGERP